MNMMLRLTFTVLLTLIVSFSADAKSTQNSTIKPALWQVEHNGVVSHLFGSIHIGKAAWYPLPDTINSAFEQSSSIVVELNTIAHGDTVQNAMALPFGTTLQQLLSPETFSKLKAFSFAYGIPLSVFEKMKPWAAASVAAVLPFMQQGLLPQYGIDMHFINAAVSNNKPIKELESIEFQLQMLQQLFKEESSFIEVLETPKSAATELVEHWQRGNINEIERLTYQQTSNAQIELILTDRNRAWLVKIERMLQGKERHFIVVGAAHLAGTSGLPALLAAKGFKVTRVNL